MRLLLIEDDEVVRSTLERDLQRAGYAVDCAADGERGEFLGSTEQYDIVVLDLGLPRLSGREVLRRWRAAGVMVPVIVLTKRDEWHERVHHPGEVLSKTYLGEHVYGLDADPDSNVIEVYINRLRQKRGRDLIRTRRGQGYMFDGVQAP